jgi:homoserine kinase
VTTIRVRAPATTANLGPGFDCVAAALDLWNELEVAEGASEPDLDHLGVRAFARLAPLEGRSFRWTDRIPRQAGALASGDEPDAEMLLAVGIELEGHPDNLAAALAGGVCLTWENRIARLAETVPAVAIAIVPEATVATAASRAALPASVPHADAAFTVARAALLGAALSGGSPDLFAAALADRLHEPYREGDAPVLGAVRTDPPPGALGATLSGSGPTVIVWAREEAAAACERALGERFPAARILRLGAAACGAVGHAARG